MLYKIVFSVALSAMLWAALPVSASAQTSSSGGAAAGDSVILEMQKAFRRGDKARLTQLLPQARGHALEAWAAYWELKARLDDASAQEVQDFLARYAGTYQEDRLRNDLLLLLGQRGDWTTFEAEYPKYRMNDDREVRCYALLAEHLKNPAQDTRLSDEVRKNWLAQRDADNGCTAAAAQLAGAKNLTQQDIWHKARLAIDANRPRAARDAVQIVAPQAVGMVNELNSSPAKFLTDKHLALRKVRKEIITLALIKLASSDVQGAAFQLEKKWALQLSREERNWLWGVLGKQAATRLGTLPASDALQYFARVSDDTDLTDDMLAWKARAALRAGSKPNWQQVQAAIQAMSEEGRNDPAWTYWKARALLATAAPDAAPSTAASGVTPVALRIAPQRAEALALLQSIASVRGFYEQLALEELGQKITVPPRPAPLSTEE
ncbi:MAG: lytic transglycosylase domain-containing protein, partial [Polaromonas sp.]|nr:lytic transglycosylase domain-containing protein [Polaromonas sp.]